MTSHRTISLTLTLLAVLMTGGPSSAQASSLLSGYGGPGEGNQMILGSALVGGGGDGGSSSGASGSAGSAAPGTGNVGTRAGRGNVAPGGSSGRGSTPGGGAGRAAGGAAGSRGGKGEAADGAVRAYPVVSGEAQPTTGPTETLGLSDGDLGYALLALGALVFIGVLTRRLARASSSRVEGANSSRNAMQDPNN